MTELIAYNRILTPTPSKTIQTVPLDSFKPNKYTLNLKFYSPTTGKPATFSFSHLCKEYKDRQEKPPEF